MVFTWQFFGSLGNSQTFFKGDRNFRKAFVTVLIKRFLSEILFQSGSEI